jgi:probable HAF family extracellular repeat protein
MRERRESGATKGWLNAGRSLKTLCGVFCCAVMSLVLIGTAKSEVRYSVTELAIGRSPGVYPVAINNAGVVVGNYLWNAISPYDPETRHAFLYRGGVMHDLGSISSDFENQVSDINNYGVIVGTYEHSDDSYFKTFGYSRSPDGTITYVSETDPFFSLLEVNAINDKGWVVGYNGGEGAFLYKEGQTSIINFGDASTAVYQEPVAINNLGQILGWYRPSNGNLPVKTVIYFNGKITEIGQIVAGASMYGARINDNSLVIGSYQLPDRSGSFLYRNGKLIDFPTNDINFAGLNNHDQIVGWDYEPVTGSPRAIIHDGTRVTLLNNLIDSSLGVKLSYAVSINDLGQICADGQDAAGRSVGFLLTPIGKCVRKR